MGWRKGALQSLRWSDVTDDVTYLRAKNSKTRKPETVPLDGELRDIVERCRAAAVWTSNDGQAHFSEYLFYDQGRPIGDFRKAWATAPRSSGHEDYWQSNRFNVPGLRDCEGGAEEGSAGQNSGLFSRSRGAKSHSYETGKVALVTLGLKDTL
jgi:integrase